MKFVKVIAVLSLLVIFPAISYIYLMKGYNFRLSALEELEAKAEISDFSYGAFETNPLSNKATIIFDGDANAALEFIQPVFEEFSHREEFQMIGFVSDSTSIANFPSSKQWYTIVDPYPYEKSISLVDTASVIRNYYNFDSTSFTKLVQHIPIIIPRKKEKDIVLKREDEK